MRCKSSRRTLEVGIPSFGLHFDFAVASRTLSILSQARTPYQALMSSSVANTQPASRDRAVVMRGPPSTFAAGSNSMPSHAALRQTRSRIIAEFSPIPARKQSRRGHLTLLPASLAPARCDKRRRQGRVARQVRCSPVACAHRSKCLRRPVKLTGCTTHLIESQVRFSNAIPKRGDISR